MVMKQAVGYNLAGIAKNDANGIVGFALQGRRKRTAKAVETIRDGTRTSSDVEVETGTGRSGPSPSFRRPR